MKRTAHVVAWILTCGISVAIGAVVYRTSNYERAFEVSSQRESSAVVVARFGQPSVIEDKGQPFLLYATSGCESPCVRRLWWEHPVLRGIEAWSVEFDHEDRLIHKTHWVSP